VLEYRKRKIRKSELTPFTKVIENNNNMNKKIYFTIAFVIIVAGGFFVWQKVNLKTNLLQPSTSSEITNKEQPTSKHPWPQFHGSYLHTGYAEVKGPEKATLKWKFKVGKIEGTSANSVVVSSDETIYVAGAGKIFAIDKDGNEIWSKNYQNVQGPAISEDGTIYFLS